MQGELFITLLFLVPVLTAAAVLPLLRKNPAWMAGAVLAAVVLTGGLFLGMTGSSFQFSQDWVGGHHFSFSLNGWKAFLLFFVFAYQLMTGVYLLKALRKIQRPYLFAAMLLLAFAAACGVILTDDLLVLLVCWEVFLVGLYAIIYSAGEHTEAVAKKALIIGGSSDFLMILGLIFFFSLNTGGISSPHIPLDGSPLAFWSFFLLFLGAGAKAGMFPFHTWIPDAAEVMPAAGFAALPASLEKILGISFLFTICHNLFVLNDTARVVMYVFAALTIFAVLIPALVEKDLKRILALTAIAPAGFMVAGLAVSELAGMAGALMYMLTHATYKSAMFFAAGNFEERFGGTSLEKLRGAARLMPKSGLGFTLAILAAISLPPTGGFMAKDLILEGLLERSQVVMLVLLALGAALNVAIFCKVAAVLWTKTEQTDTQDAPAAGWLPALLLGAAAVLTAVFFNLGGASFSLALGTADQHWLTSMWHLGPLTAISAVIFLAGAGFYVAARSEGVPPDHLFDGLRESPVLGPGLQLAAQKKFDAYEIGTLVARNMANVVFRYVDRLIDPLADGIIGIGAWLAGPFLSAIHNGVYRNYLMWVIIGFALVVSWICFN